MISAEHKQTLDALLAEYNNSEGLLTGDTPLDRFVSRGDSYLI
jgi:hypothetical protein